MQTVCDHDQDDDDADEVGNRQPVATHPDTTPCLTPASGHVARCLGGEAKYSTVTIVAVNRHMRESFRGVMLGASG